MTQAANLGALGTNAGTTGILASTGGGTGTTAGVTGFKNRIINGAMVIDQRNAGASVTPASGDVLTDRWKVVLSQASKLSAQQNQNSVTPPIGFTNYLGFTSLSAYSVGAAETFNVQQIIEGFNCADLGWGTANAKTVTLSFWVYSSLTGTFGGSFANYSVNRSYPFTYSIPVANTWTQISITVAGDTTGTWNTNNSGGIRVWFSLGCGSSASGTAGSWSANDYRSATGAVSVVGTNGATFYLTGCQLEVGTAATNFDVRSYGTELQLCQRYFFTVRSTGAANGENIGMTGLSNGGFDMHRTNMSLPVTMRVVPTISVSNVTGGGTDLRVYNGAAVQNVTVLGSQFSNVNYLQADWQLSGTFSVGQYLSVLWRDSVTNGWFRASAEL